MRCIDIRNYSRGHLIRNRSEITNSRKFQCTQSFSKYLLRNYHGQDTFPGTEDTEVNKTKSQTLCDLLSVEKRNACVCVYR